MNLRPFLVLPCALLFSIVVTLSQAAEQGAAGPKGAATREGRQKAPKPSIAKGMTAEQVLEVLGKPQEVRPIKNPQAKAEAWVYRRVIDRDSQQTATDLEVRPAFSAPGVSGETTVSVPLTRLERIITYQITWILMIDGRMELAKQTREVERSFE